MIANSLFYQPTEEPPPSATDLLDVLSLTAAHLEHRRVRGESAVLGNNRATTPADPRSTGWCLTGAVEASIYELIGIENENWGQSQRVRQAALNLLGSHDDIAKVGSPEAFNDNRRRKTESVLSVLSDLAHTLSSK